MDPRREKELDYSHQRRSAAEYPHAARRALPAKKARSRRAVRRVQASALRTAQGRIDEARVERAVSRVERTRRREVLGWVGLTLGEAVPGRLRARVDRVGWNFFKSRYDSARHRAPFVAFLTALTAGRHGRTGALAARFDRILRVPLRATAKVTWTVRSWPPDVRTQRAWLADFFADEPGWETRLRAWAGSASTDDA